MDQKVENRQHVTIEREDFEETTEVFSAVSFSHAKSGKQVSHVLIRMDGSDVGKVVRLDRERQFVLGRRQDCDLVLDVEGVSRRHARLLYDSGAYILEDLGSANGTMVHGTSVTRHRLQDGDVLQLGPMVSVRYSITDAHEEQMLEKLYEAAVRDSLTGAYNREYLSERLRAETAYAKRHGIDTALVLFDLDHFKQVNDNYGHLAGDAVLRDVVRSVSGNLRADDVLARFGGEEFAVSMRGVGLRGAEHLAERIRRTNDRTVPFEGQAIPISVSLGCAALGECEHKTPKGLIAVADRRLYAAKGSGRNRVVASG